MSRPWFEVAFGAHYPLLYAHRNETEEARCLELLPQLAPLTPPGSGLGVLDLGCGDGRHLSLIAKSVPVVGLDLSAPLLVAARTRQAPGAGPIRGIVRGDMRAIPARDRAFGGVLSLFTTFGYFGKLEANSVVIKEVARVLASGGHWFLDYLDSDRVIRDLAPHPEGLIRTRVLGPCEFREKRRLAEDRGTVIKDVTVTIRAGCEAEASTLEMDGEGLHYREEVALFPLAELDALAQKAGLQRVAGAGSYDGKALGDGDRWLLVFRKGRGEAGP